MKKSSFPPRGLSLAVLCVLSLGVGLSLLMTTCLPDFPEPPATEPPPGVCTLTGVAAIEDVAGKNGARATVALALEFDGDDEDIENLDLDKGDIDLTVQESQCIIAKARLEPVEGEPGKYILYVGAVVKNADSIYRTAVTVKPVSRKGKLILQGEKTATVDFLPIKQSIYRWFRLEEAWADGQASAPITPSGKVILKLSAEAEENLPRELKPGEILLEPLVDGMTLNKERVSEPTPITITINNNPVPGQIWEMAVSKVSKTGKARVSISKDGYLQENAPRELELYGFDTQFTSVEEDAQKNDGKQTELILQFEDSIPGLAAGNLHITPEAIAITGVTSEGNGKYRVGLRWGEVSKWAHTAMLSVNVPGYVIAPAERQVFLSMWKVDQVQNVAAGLALRRVPAGTFRRDAQASSITKLTKAYWMGETEVTRELWYAVMGYWPGSVNVPPFGAPPLGAPPSHKAEKLPVRELTWIEAVVFCNKLSILAGKTPVYSVSGSYATSSGTHAAIDARGWGAFNNPPKKFRESGSDWPADYSWTDLNYDPREVSPPYPPLTRPLLTIVEEADGYRLPSLNHWRWAAMGADMSPAKLVNGANDADWTKRFAGYNGSNNAEDYVWFGDARTVDGSAYDVFQVAMKKPNELGLYDMNGNVAEWVWDPMDGKTMRSLWPYRMVDDGSTTDWWGFYQWYGSEERLLLGGWTGDPMPRMNLSFFNWRFSDFNYTGKDTGVDGINSLPKSQGFRVMRLVQPGE